MRNISVIISAGACILAVGIANPMTAQGVQKEADKSKPIPAGVTAVLQKSCIGCHSEDGNMLAKMKFSFTKWNEYSPEEQASTGKEICEEVTDDKMPPKKFLKKHPEIKLSDEEKSIICSWTSGLSADK
jgi:hypothetical protein